MRQDSSSEAVGAVWQLNRPPSMRRMASAAWPAQQARHSQSALAGQSAGGRVVCSRGAAGARAHPRRLMADGRPCVGYAGLGAMGSGGQTLVCQISRITARPMASAGMAGSLQAHLAGAQSAFHPQLLVWNRTASKCEPLVGAGARQAASMAGAQVPRCSPGPASARSACACTQAGWILVAAARCRLVLGPGHPVQRREEAACRAGGEVRHRLHMHGERCSAGGHLCCLPERSRAPARRALHRPEHRGAAADHHPGWAC